MKFNFLEQLHRGKFISVYLADYTSEKGRNKKYEIVSRRPDLTEDDFAKLRADAVTIICFNEDKSKMLLQKEFRMTINKTVWDIPSGLIDAGETPEIAATRELKEETGLDLVRVEKVLPPCYTSIGMTNESIVPVYVIASGEITGSNSDMEEIEARWFTKEEARQLFLDSQKSFVEDKDNFIGFTNRTSSEVYHWAFD